MNQDIDLSRFVDAQAQTYAVALGELGRGSKTSHWMWFIFPQIVGLGHSATARFYAIQSLAEAVAYLSHPILGPRLHQCATTLLRHAGTRVEAMLGPIDATKLRSSMTLFEAAARTIDHARYAAFGRCLDTFFASGRDEETLRLLG